MKTISQSTFVAQMSALAMIPFSLLAAFIVTKNFGISFWQNRDNIFTIITAVAIVFTIMPHELLHLVGWKLVSKKPRSDFDIKLNLPLGANIHFDGEMSVAHFIVGAIAPFVVTSIIPMILGVSFGNFYVLAYGMLNALSCGSDFLIVLQVIPYIGRTCSDPGITGVVIN